MVQQPARRSLVVRVSEVSVARTELDTASEGEDWHGNEPPSSGGPLPPSSGVSLPAPLPPSSGAPLLASSGVSLLAPSLDLDSVVVQPALSTQDWLEELAAFHGRMNGPSLYDPDPVPSPVLPAADMGTSAEQQQRYTRSRSPPCRTVRSYEPTTNSTATQNTYEFCARSVRRVLASGATVYLGITENVGRRWSEHSMLWDSMVVLAEAGSSQITARLERQLLLEFRGHLLCQNFGPGGERASGGSPHFLYMVVRRSGLLRRR